MLRIGSYILLFYLAFRLSKHSFEFEKVSGLELVVLPLYSTLMFFITMTWKEENIIVAIVLFLLSFLIGWLQSSKVEFKDEGKKDKYERPIILMKKNWTYSNYWCTFLRQFAFRVGRGCNRILERNGQRNFNIC